MPYLQVLRIDCARPFGVKQIEGFSDIWLLFFIQIQLRTRWLLLWLRSSRLEREQFRQINILNSANKWLPKPEWFCMVTRSEVRLHCHKTISTISLAIFSKRVSWKKRRSLTGILFIPTGNYSRSSWNSNDVTLGPGNWCVCPQCQPELEAPPLHVWRHRCGAGETCWQARGPSWSGRHSIRTRTWARLFYAALVRFD